MTQETVPAGQTIQLPRSAVIDHVLTFERPEDAALALELGAFLVAIPRNWDMAPGLELCRNFYKPPRFSGDRYRGHITHGHAESKLGYADRPNQVEQLQLESAHWEKYLPAEVASLLRQMEVLTLDTLHGVLAAAGVPRADWETITGDASSGEGWCHSTVNHYRSRVRDRIGIVDHTDSGFITVLFADQPGLEILQDGHWQPVEVQNSYFIVNLGDCLEILSKNLPHPMKAVIHRVPESPQISVKEDRSSFTVFMGPRYDMPIYTYDSSGRFVEHQQFRDFSIDKAAQLGYEFHPRL
jgi:isopenicillin N synthase-like dioxygenase